MASQVISFGWRHGLPQAAKQDCIFLISGPNRQLAFKNPYHDRALRAGRGTDKAVQDNIRETPGFDEKYKVIKEVAENTPGIFFLGCTGGHHRSVFIVELLAAELQVPKLHRDFDKP